jgi:MFS family permease
VGLAIFVFVESREKRPMMPLGLFQSPAFAGANMLTLFLYAGLGGLFFFLPYNLIQVQGYEPTAAGAALLPFVLTMFILGRWAGGLVDRFGSRLPLTIGPVIAAVGFALFALPDVDSHNYWTSVFPAVMVMSIGMSISVAPLTTTVMSSVDERHAGTASGINNAVSRTAGLLAVAVFGVVMIGIFNHDLAQHLNTIQVSDEIREQIVSQSRRFVNLEIPEVLGAEQQEAVRRVVKQSFIDGFRAVAIISAGLAVLSAFFAWLLIPGRLKD